MPRRGPSPRLSGLKRLLNPQDVAAGAAVAACLLAGEAVLCCLIIARVPCRWNSRHPHACLTREQDTSDSALTLQTQR